MNSFTGDLDHTPNPNIAPHGQQPSPRPTNMQSHHPEQQSALKKYIANYDPDADPTLLMDTSEHHATFKPQAEQRATGEAFRAKLGTAEALQEAAQIMEQAGVSPETAGQVTLEHSAYLFTTTPLNDVKQALSQESISDTGTSNSNAAQIANSKESSPSVTSTDRESFSQPATKPQPSSPQVDGTRQPSTVQQQGVSPQQAGSTPATTPAAPPPCPPLGQMAAMSKSVVASSTSTNTSAGIVTNSASTGRV